VTVTLVEPRSTAALHELGRLPGVLTVEPFRSVPVHLSHGHRSRRLALLGLPLEPQLNRIVSPGGAPVPLPPGGLVLTTALAEILDAQAGDTLRVEVLTGSRRVRTVRVSRLVEEYLGTAAYMELGSLGELIDEGRSVSGAFLKIAPGAEADLYDVLDALPAVAGVTLKKAAVQGFRESISEFLSVILFFNVFFGGVISFGVIYNSAQVMLSERGRELGSLRVLGFTRREITGILLGELAALTAIAVPAGLLIGRGLAALMVTVFSSELIRIPLVVSSRTYATAAITVLAATLISGHVVRRKLHRMNLIAVLKTWE
jgi:putative ABC transport system permease protein